MSVTVRVRQQAFFLKPVIQIYVATFLQYANVELSANKLITNDSRKAFMIITFKYTRTLELNDVGKLT